MAILRSNGILTVDALPVHTPVGNEATLAFNPTTSSFYAFQGVLPWVEVNPELATNVDFSAKASLTIPVSATPTVDANGEIALDTTVTDISHGVVKVFGGEELALIAVPIAELTGLADGDVIKYNATENEFQVGPAPTSTGGIKEYKAYWSQTATDDPLLVASLVNDFGGIFTLNRESEGVYSATLLSAFPDSDKFFPTSVVIQTSAKALMFSFRRTSVDTVTLETYSHTGTAIDLEGRVCIGFQQYA